jgi:UDP-glucose 4-epimerase
MIKSILITGAHGFIGRHLSRLYANAGYAVTGIGHGNWDYHEYSQFGLTFWHTADITLDALFTYAGKPDVIVHCAGSGSVAFSMEQPHQDYVRTVANTAAVLEYIRLHSPKTVLVYPSSAAVYGDVETVPIVESAPLRPASPYGTHKVMAEELCHSYARHFGLAVVIVRFFSIYGQGLRKQLLWDACRKMSSGELTFFGTGQEVRDWLHVDDASSLLMFASAVASPRCPVVNGGSGAKVANATLLEKLRQAVGAPGPVVFNGAGRSGDPSRYVADNTQALSLGWSPRVALDEGIKGYVDWFQKLRHL